MTAALLALIFLTLFVGVAKADYPLVLAGSLAWTAKLAVILTDAFRSLLG